MDEITPAVRNEGIAAIFRGKSIPAINRSAGRAREITGGPPAAFNRPGSEAGDAPFGANHPPRLIRTQAKDLSGGTIGGNADIGRGHGVERIPRGGAVFVLFHGDVPRVIAHELIAVVVEAQAPLPATTFGAQIERSRIEGKIAAAQLERLRVALHEVRNGARISTQCAMNAIVDAPGKAVQ